MTTPLATAPNSALPIGFRKKITEDLGADVEKHAAGVVFVAPDGDILLLRRSNAEANYAGHWALPGGGVDAGETPQQGAVREAKEEIGVDTTPEALKPLDRRMTPTGSAYHTFAAPVEKKFAPTLNDEHTGYAWASLDMLPQPLHPAVEQTLREQVGMADDMSIEEWKRLRRHFGLWMVNRAPDDDDDDDVDAAEGEGGEGAGDVATDSALRLALDRDTVRELDRDGRMRVSKANISRACVNPYRGREIPDWQKLGLDPDKIYHLLRDPEELKKAAKSFNGVQILRKHVPVNAQDHQPYDVVGSTGTEAAFDGEYLTNSLSIWVKDAIDGIESDFKKELSSGYHYTPDMTPGTFRGNAFDGVMRDIVGNHVALVEDGRAGPDVVVGDSTENLHMKPTRLAARALLMTGACMSPVLAMDATLPQPLFKDITSKNFGEKKPLIIAAAKKAVTGKTRRGMALDETLLSKLLDDVGNDDKDEVDKPVSEKQHETMQAAAKGSEELAIPKATGGEEFFDKDNEGKKKPGLDAAAVKEWLTGKGMSGDDLAEFDTTFPPQAKDEDDEAKKKREEDEKNAKDAAMKDMVTRPAMDAAIKTAVDSTEKRVIERERGIRTALHTVKPWIGELAPSLAFDSGEAVYRHALGALGVDGAKTLHHDALLPVLQAQPKPGAKPNVDVPKLGMDAAARDSMKQIIGIDLDRIGTA